MLFLGVLSVIQLVLVPGLLLIRYFPARHSPLQKIIYVFMLSLLGNYVGIFLLVTVGLYTRAVVLVIFALEVTALVWINREKLTFRLDSSMAKGREGVAKAIDHFNEWQKRDFLSATLFFVFSVAAGLSLLWLLSLWTREFTHVFNAWDTYASWDRWAEKWAQNRFPGDTWEYPQLIPVSFSITYKFIGTTAVKFFAKSIMPLFSFMIVLMLVDLGWKQRSFGYMAGAGLALFGIVSLLREYVAEGYVDIPVACFSLMAIYTLLKAQDSHDVDELKQTLWLGSLATAAALVTKQTGGYVAVLYPVFAYFWLIKNSNLIERREGLRLLAKQILVFLLIVAPWYALAVFRILTGGNSSNIDYVTKDIYAGQTLLERFVVACQSLGSYVYLFVFLLLSLPVLEKRFRQVVLLIVFPFSILWALFLSYELRNLAVALPLVGMSSGVALESWINWGQNFKARARQIPAYAVLLVAGAALAGATLLVNGEAIVQRQIKEQRLIFEPLINQQLYDYFQEQGEPEIVISSYPVGWLPDLEAYWVKDRFTNYDAYQATLSKYPDVELLLLRTDIVDEQIWNDLQMGLAEGNYEQIFVRGNYLFMRIPPR